MPAEYDRLDDIDTESVRQTLGRKIILNPAKRASERLLALAAKFRGNGEKKTKAQDLAWASMPGRQADQDNEDGCTAHRIYRGGGSLDTEDARKLGHRPLDRHSRGPRGCPAMNIVGECLRRRDKGKICFCSRKS